MLRQLSIRSKLLALLLLSGIALIAATGLVADRSGSTSLRQAIFDQLTTLKESKKAEIERYFSQTELNFLTLAQAPVTADAMVVLGSSYRVLGGEKEPLPELTAFYENEVLARVKGLTTAEPDVLSYMPSDPAGLRLQNDYIARNERPADEKVDLLSGPSANHYDIAHARYHTFFRKTAEAGGLGDLFLIDATTGNVVYSVYKGIDLGGNVFNGPLAQSGLGRAVAAALRKGAAEGSAALEDFSAYLPSYLAPAAFVATPIARDGQLYGVLAAEVAIDKIDEVMTFDGGWADVGLGRTGEVYLVGPQRTMRSASRFQRESPDAYYASLQEMGVGEEAIERIRRFNSPILNQPVKSVAAEETLEGRSGTAIISDYRGVQALASWSPVNAMGMDWGIVAKKDADEALAPVGDFRKRLAQVAAGAAAVLTLVSLFAAGAFTRPIREVLGGVNRLAAGDETTRIEVSGSDEFSELGRAFNTMADEITARSAKIAQKTGEYEALLRNVFPEIAAERMKEGEQAAAETVRNVAVAVINIDGINTLVTEKSEDTLKLINELIGDLDEAAAAANVEKIHTFGETYVAACGLSTPRLDGANRILAFVDTVADIVARHARSWNIPLAIKAGVTFGDVEVGLVGRQRTIYSMWGVTVLRARRIVFDADPNTVRVTKTVIEHLPEGGGFQEKSQIVMSGSDKIDTWQRLAGARQAVAVNA